jgi:Uncharacterized protein conserved in bacteria (DUF2255)
MTCTSARKRGTAAPGSGASPPWAPHVRAADVDRDVTVKLTGTEACAEIDEAYRVKYARYAGAYVQPMTADAAATTLLRTPSPRKDDDHGKQ